MTETPQQYIARMLAFVGTREPVGVLRGTASAIAVAIAERPAAELRWTSSPERWSAAAIVAHLADAEIVASYRLRMILASPGVAIQAFDQNAWAAAFRYNDQDASASLAIFRTLRESWLKLLSGMDDSCLDRYGVHEERGRETVRHLLRLYAGHDLNHLQQIARILDEGDRAGRGPARSGD